MNKPNKILKFTIYANVLPIATSRILKLCQERANLNILKNLKDLKAYIVLNPDSFFVPASIIISINEMITTIPSKILKLSKTYSLNPIPKSFIIISIAKIPVKT